MEVLLMAALYRPVAIKYAVKRQTSDSETDLYKHTCTHFTCSTIDHICNASGQSRGLLYRYIGLQLIIHDMNVKPSPSMSTVCIVWFVTDQFHPFFVY